MSIPAVPYLSRLVTAIEESATLAIDAKAKALKAAGEDVIGFGAGEPDFATPAHIVAAAEEACRQPRFHHYTPTAGLPELREAVAGKTSRDLGVPVTRSSVNCRLRSTRLPPTVTARLQPATSTVRPSRTRIIRSALVASLFLI